MPGTSFLLLQAPPNRAISLGPHSWGPRPTDVTVATGLALDLPEQTTAGILRYQAILRSISNEGRIGQERKAVGQVRIDTRTKSGTLECRFVTVLRTDLHERFSDVHRSIEVDMSWLADDGMPPLMLRKLPSCI